MKKPCFVIVYFLFAFIFVLNSNAWDIEGGRLQVGGEYSIDFYYDHVYGNVGKSDMDVHKAKKDNYHYNEKLYIDMGGEIEEDLNLEFRFRGRHSTDKNVQAHRYELDEFYLGLTGKNYELGLGDLSEQYSLLTFYQSFFGFKANYKVEDLLTLKVLAGTNKMWEEDQYEQIFGGGMLIFTPNPNLQFETSYMHTEITELYPNATESDYRNDVWSVKSIVYLLDKRVTLLGEIAFSEHTVDRRDPQSETLDGKAFALGLIIKPLREELNFIIAYAYFEPNFRAVMGVHPSDWEEFLWYVTYEPSDIFNIVFYYQFYRNRLTEESDEIYRTNTHNTKTIVTLNPFKYREDYFNNLTLNFDFNYTHEKSEDIPASVNNQNITVNISALNSVERYWGEFGWKLGFGLVYDIDRRLHKEDILTTEIDAGFNYSTDAYGLDFVFNMGFSIEFVDEYFKYPRRTLTKTTPKFTPEITITNNRWLPYKTILTVGYEGILIDEELEYDTMESVTTVSLSQVLFERRDIISTIELKYLNHDYRSQNPVDRYGEDEYRLTFNLKF